MSNALIYLGKTYSDGELVQASFSRKKSLNMFELSVDTVDITVHPYLNFYFFTNEPYPFYTRDGYGFHTTEANPFAESFHQNTPLMQYVDGSQIAIWYLQDIRRIGRAKYRLNGFSSVGRLTQITHYGGVYTGDSVASVVADIMGNIPYSIESQFENTALYGWLPIATARDNLRQVLFAINANLHVDANGVIRIQNLPVATQALVEKGKIFKSNASVKYDKPVTKVVVVEHQYAVGGETKELFSGEATGNQLIAFDEPVVNLVATSGLVIVEPQNVTKGTNYAIVSGTGTLTGTSYIHTMREIERTVSTEDVDNVIRVESATLVGILASSDVADRLLEYYQHRNYINIAAADLFLNAGSVVDVFDPYDEIVRSACIESEQVSLSNIPKSSISALVGFTPWQTVPFEDVRQLLTGSGTFTVPAGVTQITIVLIGGGGGGDGGESGTDGGSVSGSWFYRSGETISAQAGAAGKGGKAGAAGSAGKILRIEITVTPGQTFAYNCGSAGVGGAIATAGSEGGETTFGPYSSATGSASPSGYTDPVTGDVYARPGVNGTDGGDGGSGGGYSATEGPPGADGSPVGNFSGGKGGTGAWTRYGPFSDPIGYQSQGGGGAGGASAEAAGGDGSSEHYMYRPMVGASGGTGAPATNRLAKTAYGDGGDGGDGGGGGGGAGGFSFRITGEDRVTQTYTAAGGVGGTGARGGNGAVGCGIAYYRRPVTT